MRNVTALLLIYQAKAECTDPLSVIGPYKSGNQCTVPSSECFDEAENKVIPFVPWDFGSINHKILYFLIY